jgi:hypothetical protein
VQMAIADPSVFGLFFADLTFLIQLQKRLAVTPRFVDRTITYCIELTYDRRASCFHAVLHTAHWYIHTIFILSNFTPTTSFDGHPSVGH